MPDMPGIKDPWGMLERSPDAMEGISSVRRTFAGDVLVRFRSKFTSVLGLALIAVITLFAVAGPRFSPFSYEGQNLEHISLPPFFKAIEAKGGLFYITANLKLVEVDRKGGIVGALSRVSTDEASKRVVFGRNGSNPALTALTTFTMDYSSRPYTLLDESGASILSRRFVWNRTYLLGSDNLGRDIMTRLMYGTRVSLLVAFAATLANLLIGVLFGSVSAYCGGMVDTVMMRIVDIINTLPLTLYVILIMVFLGAGLSSIIVALGTVYWVNMARVVRGEILSLKQRDFVVASKTIGSPPSVILFRHLIPNAMGPILVTLTMLIPQAIFMEAFLSFIGIGIPAPLASLGTMCSDALGMLRTAPYQIFEPAFAICALTFGFNFVGDGLRDALDPKLRK
jgi:oligopeptide transport system permease protein